MTIVVNPDSSQEERLARMIRLLPAAPEAWVHAAVEIPALHAQIDAILARAEDDAAFRAALGTNPDQAVRAAGFDASEPLLALLRAALPSP